jgi:hypothetical protein
MVAVRNAKTNGVNNMNDPNKEINAIWQTNPIGLVVLAVCWLILLVLAI